MHDCIIPSFELIVDRRCVCFPNTLLQFCVYFRIKTIENKSNLKKINFTGLGSYKELYTCNPFPFSFFVFISTANPYPFSIPVSMIQSINNKRLLGHVLYNNQVSAMLFTMFSGIRPRMLIVKQFNTNVVISKQSSITGKTCWTSCAWIY